MEAQNEWFSFLTRDYAAALKLLSSVAVDGVDGNGLKLLKKCTIFSGSEMVS